MKLIRNGLAPLAATIALAGCVSASSSGRAVTFHSPAELEEIRKIPHVRVIHKQDYTEIRYPSVRILNKDIRIVENIEEDGSVFHILENKKYLYKNIQEYGYWGYHLDSELKIYFVDEDLNPDPEYYRDLDYTYDYIVISDRSVVAERCHYKFQAGDGGAIQALLNLKKDSFSQSPLPLAISAVLAKGAIRKSDNCAPNETLGDSTVTSAQSPAR